jgi:hypothetical protein
MKKLMMIGMVLALATASYAQESESDEPTACQQAGRDSEAIADHARALDVGGAVDCTGQMLHNASNCVFGGPAVTGKCVEPGH